MPSNGKEYQAEYMKKYVTNAQNINCEICGGKYKTYSKYRHVKTKKHLQAENRSKVPNVIEVLMNKIDRIEKIINDPEESKIRKSLLEIVNDVHKSKLRDLSANDTSSNRGPAFDLGNAGAFSNANDTSSNRV